MSRATRIAIAALLTSLAVPQLLLAQPAPAATDTAPVVSEAPAPTVGDPAVDAFYAGRGGAPIWLKDEAGRAAAQSFAVILRNAELDGLADGRDLSRRVEAAIVSPQPDADKIISTAWVRYVRTLKGPVQGMEYGDPSLTPVAPSAEAILGQAAVNASLGDFVTRTAAVNPLYSALRDAAVKAGATDDRHVRATLERLRLIPAKGRAILVDAANAELWMLEDGQPVDSMKVVVGKKVSPTPLVTSTVNFVTFNPYWHIPDDVARDRVAPVVIKRGVSYLKAARYQTAESYSSKAELVDPVTIDWKGVAAGTTPVYMRQLPGPGNMMGAMKFGFANKYDIYLHDTPKDARHQALFAKAQRDYSMGCIRLEHAERLARWLLGRDPVAPGPADEPEQNVQLDHGVPVYVSYLTATVTDGRLVFADDVYGFDSATGTLASGAASASAAH